MPYHLPDGSRGQTRAMQVGAERPGSNVLKPIGCGRNLPGFPSAMAWP